MRPTPSRILARRVAEALFRSGIHLVDRLLLEMKGVTYGEWGFGQAVDKIEAELNRKVSKK